jgi:hypothetical protein
MERIYFPTTCIVSLLQPPAHLSSSDSADGSRRSSWLIWLEVDAKCDQDDETSASSGVDPLCPRTHHLSSFVKVEAASCECYQVVQAEFDRLLSKE